MSLRPAWLYKSLYLYGFVAEPVESGTNSTVWMEEEYTCRLAFYAESTGILAVHALPRFFGAFIYMWSAYEAFP